MQRLSFQLQEALREVQQHVPPIAQQCALTARGPAQPGFLIAAAALHPRFAPDR